MKTLPTKVKTIYAQLEANVRGFDYQKAYGILDEAVSRLGDIKIIHLRDDIV